MRAFAEKQGQTQRKGLAIFLGRGKPPFEPTHETHSILRLQRIIGNQATQRLLSASAAGHEANSRTMAATRFAHDFSRIPVHATVPAQTQAKRTVNAPGDVYEQEADRVAERVMNIADPAHLLPVQRAMAAEEKGEQVQTAAAVTPLAPQGMLLEEAQQPTQTEPSLQRAEKGDGVEASHHLESLPGGNQGGGSPLPDDVRTFMEPRFGFDFSQVRVHVDRDAMRMSRSLNAQAFTHHQHIYFGAGKTPAKDALTAHELTHVLQQAVGLRLGTAQQRRPLEEEGEREYTPATANRAAIGRLQGQPAHIPSIQRVVEIRPPGRGEASAFDRRQELIDQLNAQSAAIQYRLDGRVLLYDVIDEAALTNFDRQMRGFIDRAEVAPMRLITSAGLVGGQRVLVDFFDLGYVDLDDLLASDDHSFQMNLIHILAERFRVRNYARRIGTNFSDAEFNRAHQAGLEAETELLRDVFGDPTIRFIYEETRPNGTDVFGFRSQEGYWVFHVFRRAGRGVRGGEVFVQTQDRRRLTIEEFRAEREAAAPAVP